MIHMGLSLLTVALESGADHIAQFQSLLALVKDEMAKQLVFVSCSTTLHYECSAQFSACLQQIFRSTL